MGTIRPSVVKSKCDLQGATPCFRELFAGQSKLLYERARRGLRVDAQSVVNLVKIYILMIFHGEDQP